jgi:hypothetical protein
MVYCIGSDLVAVLPLNAVPMPVNAWRLWQAVPVF